VESWPQCSDGNQGFDLQMLRQSFLKIGTCFFLISLLWTCSQSFARTNGFSSNQKDRVEEILKKALNSRREYVEAFRNLTADEIKLTEVFDENGKLKERRSQLASFLVYQSQLNNQTASEYRFIREVDGKSVNDQFERAEKLFSQLAAAKDRESELKKLRQENLRYTLRYYRWDITLHPAAQLEEKRWPEYNYEIIETGKLGDREVVVLGCRRKSFYSVQAKGLLSAFKDPYVGDQGRLWLDAKTFQIYRWENESIVRHAETGTMLVYMRDEVDYAQSELGIPVPKRIVVSFYDKLRYKPRDTEVPRALLGGRITYTYGTFKRFEVTSKEQVR
jgi:hypothetical protein